MIGGVGNSSEQARRMRSSGLGTAHESSHLPGHLQVGSSGLGERIHQPVGTPVDGSKALAVAFLDIINGLVRLVRRDPDELSLVTIPAMSSPTECAILFHTLASGLA